MREPLAPLHLDVDVGKERRKEDQDCRHIPLGDPVAPQPRPTEDLDDLLGESPRGDRLYVTVTHQLEHFAGDA